MPSIIAARSSGAISCGGLHLLGEGPGGTDCGLRQVGEAHAFARQRRDLLDLQADRFEPRRVRVSFGHQVAPDRKGEVGAPLLRVHQPA
jgi:hypothetical protein